MGGGRGSGVKRETYGASRVKVVRELMVSSLHFLIEISIFSETFLLSSNAKLFSNVFRGHIYVQVHIKPNEHVINLHFPNMSSVIVVILGLDALPLTLTNIGKLCHQGGIYVVLLHPS